MDISEKCDRCGKVFTQRVEYGEKVRSQLRPYDELCWFDEYRLRGLKAPKKKRPGGHVAGQRSDVFIFHPMPKDETLRPRKAKVCPECVQDYNAKHRAFIETWLHSYGKSDEPEKP